MNENKNIIKCPNCGNNLKSDATSCYICGYNLSNKTLPSNSVAKIDPSYPQYDKDKVDENVRTGVKLIKSLIISRIINKLTYAIFVLIVIALLFGGFVSDKKYWVVIVGIIIFLVIIIIILRRIQRK